MGVGGGGRGHRGRDAYSMGHESDFLSVYPNDHNQQQFLSPSFPSNILGMATPIGSPEDVSKTKSKTEPVRHYPITLLFVTVLIIPFQ